MTCLSETQCTCLTHTETKNPKPGTHIALEANSIFQQSLHMNHYSSECWYCHLISYPLHTRYMSKDLKNQSHTYFLFILKRDEPFLKLKSLYFFYFVLLFCFCMINIIGTLYKFSHNLSVHTFAKKQYIILRDVEARLQGHSLKKKIFLCSIGSQNSNIFLKQLSRKQVKAIQCVAVGEFIRKLLFTLLT